MAKLLFVGDVVMTSGENVSVSPAVRDYIYGHDIRCCNFEGAVIGKSTNVADKIGPSISQSDNAVDNLIQVGFNCFCLANNHIFDYGVEGLEKTEEALSGQKVVGASIHKENVYKPLILDISGSVVGIINAAENGFGCEHERKDGIGYAWIHSENIRANIEQLKIKCDVVIVVSHAGLEKVNYPLPEWRNTYHKLIEYGADMVIAHHPHVVQGWEEYKGKPIFYSLGNFIWQKSQIYPTETIAVSVEVCVDRTIKYAVKYMQFEGNIIDFCDNENFRHQVEMLCNIWNDNDAYLDTINQECLKAFERSYIQYYLNSLSIGNCSSLIGRIKQAIKLIFRGINVNNLFLLHNIMIETHIWTCKRALYLREKRGEKNEN